MLNCCSISLTIILFIKNNSPFTRLYQQELLWTEKRFLLASCSDETYKQYLLIIRVPSVIEKCVTCTKALGEISDHNEIIATWILSSFTVFRIDFDWFWRIKHIFGNCSISYWIKIVSFFQIYKVFVAKNKFRSDWAARFGACYVWNNPRRIPSWRWLYFKKKHQFNDGWNFHIQISMNWLILSIDQQDSNEIVFITIDRESLLD